MTRTEIITETARNVGTEPVWLDKLINFETAGTYSPTIKNPKSSARGLLQFMDSTAQQFGYGDSLDLVNRYPTFESQMKGPVTQYLKQWPSHPTEKALYLSVFYPAYRTKNIDTPFPASVQAANPGIRTPRDYINLIRSRVGTLDFAIDTATVALALIAGAGAYLYIKSRRKRKRK